MNRAEVTINGWALIAFALLIAWLVVALRHECSEPADHVYKNGIWWCQRNGDCPVCSFKEATDE